MSSCAKHKKSRHKKSKRKPVCTRFEPSHPRKPENFSAKLDLWLGCWWPSCSLSLSLSCSPRWSVMLCIYVRAFYSHFSSFFIKTSIFYEELALYKFLCWCFRPFVCGNGIWCCPGEMLEEAKRRNVNPDECTISREPGSISCTFH